MSDTQILMQIMQTLNTFQSQTIKAINDLREEVKENKREIQKSREIEEAHWEENERRWEENEKRWINYEKNRIKDKSDIIKIFTTYEDSIARTLGDKNVEKMEQLV